MSYIDLTTIILLEVYIQTNINQNDYFPIMRYVEGYENTGMNAFPLFYLSSNISLI